MTVPGSHLPAAASTGPSPTPRSDRDAVTTRGVGAAAGNLHLTPTQEEDVAAYLARVWRGATGLPEIPGPEQLVALVSLTLRKAREAVAFTAADLPY